MLLDDAILFEDAEALLIDKPAGLPVDPPRDGGPSIVGRANELRLSFMRSPVPVHRLDRDTSGCLLLARNPRALKQFQAAFAERIVTKSYLAIVAGRPPGEAGVINQALAKRSSREAGWRMIPDPAGLSAETSWEWLGSVGGTSLLRLTPTTGRTHQLRVHCASALGCAILGDPVYGRTDRRGMMLHASTLVVPRTGKMPITGAAPWPTRFLDSGYAGLDA